MYLDISIVDSGKVGIFETTLENIDNKWRNISDETNNTDREVLLQGLNDFKDNKDKETEYLFNLYFQPQKPLLSRQKKEAEKSFGLKLFVEFITKNHGIFTVKTNKYKSRNETIGFSLYDHYEYHRNTSDSPFGTTYNIVVPIKNTVEKKENASIKEENNKKENITPTSRTVFIEMLSLNKFNLAQLPFNDIHKTFNEKNIKKQYMIAKTEEDLNYIAVISLSSIFKGDKTDLYRAFKEFLNNNSICKSLVIRNIKEETIKNVVDLLPSESTQPVLFDAENKKVIILITPEDKIFIFAGETNKDCININKFLSQENKNFSFLELKASDPLGDEIALETKPYLDDNPFFINRSQMIKTDLFETDDNNVTEFEKKTKCILEKNIDDGGYNWKNSHLKISSKLHLRDFIYGKKLFQTSRYAFDFAFLLSKDIFKQIIKLKGTTVDKYCYTLIGYGYYSELLVSQTCEFIKIRIEQHNKSWQEELKLEYIIMKDEEDMNFSRYFQNLKTRKKGFEAAQERLIIVIPISSTLTTCLKIENSLTKQLKKRIDELQKPDDKDDKDLKKTLERVLSQDMGNKLFVQPFYTIVVVSDDVDFEKLVEDWEKVEGVLRKSKVWAGVEKDRAIITENREHKLKYKEDDPTRRNKFNIYIKSKWYFPKDCEMCFPKDGSRHEKPLFKTDKVSVTPSLIFDKPHWYEKTNKIFFDFMEEIAPVIPDDHPIFKSNMVDWAHYESDHKQKHYTYYIHYSSVISQNRNRIKNWASVVKEVAVENIADKKIGQLKNVLLVAPDKNENGEFLHLINRFVFDDRANIIKFDKSSDYYTNFKKFFEYDIDQNDLSIFFVDNLMASANTFLGFYEDVIIALNNDNTEQKHNKKLKIKGVFCLINRMDYVRYSNVQDILGEKNNIFSFMQLNVFENLDPHIFCPLCNTEDMWKELINNASCDCIKRYALDNEKKYFKKIEKSDLTIRKFPYTIKKNEANTLLKMMLIHFIYNAFADTKDETKYYTNNIIGCLDKRSVTYIVEFNYFVDILKNYITYHNQTNFFEIYENDTENIKFKANLIKVLTHHHLKRHRGINIAVFGWVRTELIKISNNIHEILNILKSKDEPESVIFDKFSYLRLLIKYGATLKTAYLLNEDFLRAMCYFIKKIECFLGKEDGFTKIRDEYKDFRIYCTTHIIRSIRKNEQRSIKLEENLNKLLKENNKNYSTPFLELLILENTSVIYQTLNKLKIDEDIPTEESIDSFIDELFYNDDVRVRDFCDCYGEDKKNQLKYILKLSRDLTKNENDIDDNDAGNIVKQIAEIVGYKNDDEENYGGLLLLKYQDINKSEKEGNSKLNKIESLQKSESDYIIVGKAGNEIFNDFFDFDQANEEWKKSFAVKMLNGKKYLENTSYEWTNYTIYNDTDGKWKGQGRDDENIEDCSEIRILKENQQKRFKRLLFIRVAEQKDKANEDYKEKAEVGDAVFVFYDTKQNNDHFSIHNVRYAHVLRNELIDYFKRRYNDDTFRAWVKQKERNEYAFVLNHGISTYEMAKDSNLEELKNNPAYEPIFKMLLQYLVNKINLLSLVNSDKKQRETISVKQIVEKFENSYVKVFSFVHPEQISIYKAPEYKDLIKFDSTGVNDKYYNDSVSFPKGFLDELTFELFYNIRKHVINENSKQFSIDNKLIIKLSSFVNKGMLNLSLENNFYKPQPCDYKNKAHGNTLINKILLNYNIGKLTRSISEKDKTYKIVIPIGAV